MSWLYLLKPYKDLALQPVSSILHQGGVTPNMLTAAGLALSVFAGLLAAWGYLSASVVVFLTGALLDALDGSLARACGKSTEFGRYFDSVCDRLSELAFVAGAVVGGAPTAAFLVVGGSFLLLASRIYNHLRGLSSDAAMFGRPERLTLLIAGLLASAPFNLALFATACLLCLVSSLQALASGIRSSRDQDHSQIREPSLR